MRPSIKRLFSGKISGNVSGRRPAWAGVAFAALLAVAGAQDAPFKELVREPLYDKLWQDPEVEQRIQDGIRQNRMGFASLQFVDAKGAPVKNVQIKLEQTRHDFLFGCTIFMLNQFKTEAENQRYEKAFASIFNHAYIPFYWSDLEPEQGKPRFAKDSAPIYRRPPPDACVEFCKRYNIVPKGHLLTWYKFMPNWLPDDREAVHGLMIKRFEEIAARYGKDIKMWDVVEEACDRPPEVMMPRDYVFRAMKDADRIFPPDSILSIGETTENCWYRFHLDSSSYYLQLSNLAARGARFDVLGFQCFPLLGSVYGLENNYGEILSGRIFRPKDIFQVLDQYADFQRPMHITQLGIPSGGPAGGPHAEENQAIVARNLYRLFFSYPNMEAITWWNIADGTAYPIENVLKNGLLNADFTPKPAYTAIENLIKKEWWTRLEADSGANAELRVHGFYGDYQLTTTHEGKTTTHKIHLVKKGQNEFKIQID